MKSPLHHVSPVLVVQQTGRLVCLLCLAWFATHAARSWSAIDERSTPAAPGGDPTLAAAILPADGFWEFADSSLQIQRGEMSEAELDVRLAQMQDIQGPGRPEATNLADLAAAHGATRVDTGRAILWVLETPTVRFRLATTRDEVPRLLAALMATRSASGWDTVRLRSAEAPATDSHLLPLGEGCETVCVRRAADGLPGMELVRTSRSADQLLQSWRRDGWDVRHTDWGSKNSFSFLCVRGDCLIYAWSAARRGSRTIMLTRTSASLGVQP